MVEDVLVLKKGPDFYKLYDVLILVVVEDVLVHYIEPYSKNAQGS